MYEKESDPAKFWYCSYEHAVEVVEWQIAKQRDEVEKK
jgi:hypothetical protein